MSNAFPSFAGFQCNSIYLDQDPLEKGWIFDDGEHLSASALNITAQALAKLGYEPARAGQL